MIQERLEREFDISLILTVPSVQYIFHLSDGTEKKVDNPAHFPDPAHIGKIEEPFIKATILIPERYMGVVMTLCIDRRGENTSFHYPIPGRIEFQCELPLAEVIYDFYDKLKSVTQGYGSFDYEMIDYRKSDLVKLDILVNGESVDALSVIIHRDKAYNWGQSLNEKLRQLIPRQMYEVVIQAAIGNNQAGNTPVVKMATAQLDHLTCTDQDDGLTLQVTKNLFCEHDSCICDRNRVFAYTGFAANFFTRGECVLKQAIQDFTDTTRLASQLPGFLQLANDLRFTKYQRLQASGNPEEMANRLLSFLYIAVFVHFRITQAAFRLQPATNLFTALFLANAVNLCAIAGADDNDFFNAFQLIYFLHTQRIVRTRDCYFLAGFQSCRVVADSSGKQWHG